MDTDRLERRYYSYTVSKLVTPDYPPTFLWYGRNDLMLKAFVYPLQGPTLAKALEASGVPNRVEVTTTPNMASASAWGRTPRTGWNVLPSSGRAFRNNRRKRLCTIGMDRSAA